MDSDDGVSSDESNSDHEVDKQMSFENAEHAQKVIAEIMAKRQARKDAAVEGADH